MTIEDIYDEFEGRLRRYAMSLARDSDAADDLVQETLIRASAHVALLGHLNGYQQRAWLFRALKNLFIDEQRSRKRREALVEQLGAQTEFVGEPPALSSPGLLDHVPERDRELLEMRYVEGMTSREISEDLGIPAATVRSRLHLAIKRLRGRRDELLY
ncbi:MAG: RNA polymerase sigma factor [Chloroflexi bacterium]|nr:RNA polymerase sigma factor [Chloroflexota bacterium]